MAYKYDVWGFNEKGEKELQAWCGVVKTKKEIGEWYDRFGRHHEAHGYEIVRLFKLRGTSVWKAVIAGKKISLSEYKRKRRKT